MNVKKLQKKIAAVFCGVCCLPIKFVLAVVFIVIGSLHIYNCETAPGLPIGVIVFGACLFLVSLISPMCFARVKKKRSCLKKSFAAALMLLFIGFVVLSVFTYMLYKPRNSDCNETFYMTIFICVTIMWVVLVISLWISVLAYYTKKKIGTAIEELGHM